ncbi:hypothetical protein QBC37DRAFT_463254 [Rhypophila decipiens]|uniref:Uncharacterized protein n=1 Tax=Rhypophila decipiens TaxID=261697 RepID=A0AAN6YHT6_9PEZI|nr:hypothetical protein QBC37DRAFT_463254 [Rhypophila decipiens]
MVGSDRRSRIIFQSPNGKISILRRGNPGRKSRHASMPCHMTLASRYDFTTSSAESSSRRAGYYYIQFHSVQNFKTVSLRPETLLRSLGQTAQLCKLRVRDYHIILLEVMGEIEREGVLIPTVGSYRVHDDEESFRKGVSCSITKLPINADIKDLRMLSVGYQLDYEYKSHRSGYYIEVARCASSSSAGHHAKPVSERQSGLAPSIPCSAQRQRACRRYKNVSRSRNVDSCSHFVTSHPVSHRERWTLDVLDVSGSCAWHESRRNHHEQCRLYHGYVHVESRWWVGRHIEPRWIEQAVLGSLPGKL